MAGCLRPPWQRLTTWQNDAIAVLPQMVDRRYQLQLALNLDAGRAEGWPIVRAVIAENDVNRIYTALGGIEKFDGLPNPIGGQPIDVAKELHQLAATTNLMWPTVGPVRQRIKDHIEAKAVQIEKMKQQLAR